MLAGRRVGTASNNARAVQKLLSVFGRQPGESYASGSSLVEANPTPTFQATLVPTVQ